MHSIRLVLLLSLGLLFPAKARAGGFYVPEIGTRAAGMGAAVVADPQDPSAIFHNPAGMLDIDGLQLQLSGTVFLPRVEYFRRPLIDPNTNQEVFFEGITNTNRITPAAFFGAVSDLGGEKFSAGIAVSAPFGAIIEYPEDGSQRMVVTSVDLKAIHVSPAIAYKVNDRIRVGAALNYIFAEFKLKQGNAWQYVLFDPENFPDPTASSSGDTVLEGHDAFSLSGTFGAVYVHPGNKFRFGVSVLTPVTLRIKGDARITNANISQLIDIDNNIVLQEAGQREDRFRTEIPLPLILRLGAAVRPTPNVLFAFDFNWQRWSTFDQLVIDFENEYELLPISGAYLYDVVAEQNWNDSISLRLATEIAPSGSSPLRFRGSVLYDTSPIDDQSFDLITPESDKFGVGLGVGYQLRLSKGSNLVIDLAYQHLFFAERDINPASGTNRTILNKAAPSFYYGVTRASFDVVHLSTRVQF